MAQETFSTSGGTSIHWTEVAVDRCPFLLGQRLRSLFRHCKGMCSITGVALQRGKAVQLHGELCGKRGPEQEHSLTVYLGYIDWLFSRPISQKFPVLFLYESVGSEPSRSRGPCSRCEYGVVLEVDECFNVIYGALLLPARWSSTLQPDCLRFSKLFSQKNTNVLLVSRSGMLLQTTAPFGVVTRPLEPW